MANDYMNLVLLKGRLGKDPEMRFLPSGDAVCNFNIATRSGQHVEWHRIVTYKKLAEYAKETFATGDLVFVQAEIRTRDMVTAEDNALGRKPRKILELIADKAHLVAKRGSAADDEPATAGEDDSGPSGAPDNPTQGGDSPTVPTFI